MSGWVGSRAPRAWRSRGGFASLLSVVPVVVFVLVGPLRAQESIRGITLDEAIALALERNPIMQAAERQVETARVQFELADTLSAFRADLRGSVSSLQPLTSIEFPDPITGGRRRISLGEPVQRQLSLQLTQPLFTHSATRIARHGAQTSVELAQHQQATTEADLVLAVEQAVFGLLGACSLEGVASEALERAKLYLRVAQARVEAGTAARLDVIQAQVDVADAEHHVIQAKGAIQQAQNALNNILGLPPGTSVSVADVKDLPTAAPANEETAVEQALAQRPELAQLRTSIELARIQARAYSKQDNPQVAISTTSTYQQGSPFRRGFSTDIVLGVTVPLSDGGTVDAQRHQAQKQAEQLEAQHEVLKQSIDLQVRQALVNLRVAWDELRLAEASLEEAREAFRVSLLAYETGVGPRITVKDAQVGLTAAETRVVQSIYDYRTAFAQFKRAAGVRPLAAGRSSPRSDQHSEGTPEKSEVDRGETDGRANPTPAPETGPGEH